MRSRVAPDVFEFASDRLRGDPDIAIDFIRPNLWLALPASPLHGFVCCAIRVLCATHHLSAQGVPRFVVLQLETLRQAKEEREAAEQARI